jgi:signal transduction histidine kinase
MRIPEIIHSTAFRLALGFALAVTLSTSFVFALVYLDISASEVKRLRAVLVDEAAKGAAESNEDLKRALELRLTRDLRRLDYVALFDAKGALVFGNVERLPDIPLDGAAYFVAEIRAPGLAGPPEPALFVARRRADGGVLALGRSLIEVYAIRRTALRALATGAVPTILLALAIGAFFARNASRRLARIHETIARIMQGDMTARLPVGGGADDIDKVTKAVNVMLDEIARLLDQLKSVGDNIAHDLRTPLAVVRAKLERGLSEASSVDDLRAAAIDAIAQVDKAVATIAALLRIAEVESRLRSSAFGPIDLTPICAELFEFYEPLAQSRGIVMTIRAHGPTPMPGDADLMREALSNLIDNAIRFAPSGGTVTVDAAMGSGEIVVSVGDDGPGVAPGDRERIFERFYRGAANDAGPGFGLGLSIAKTIASVHGLDLRVVDNKPGARFELSTRHGANGREELRR